MGRLRVRDGGAMSVGCGFKRGWDASAWRGRGAYGWRAERAACDSSSSGVRLAAVCFSLVCALRGTDCAPREDMRTADLVFHVEVCIQAVRDVLHDSLKSKRDAGTGAEALLADLKGVTLAIHERISHTARHPHTHVEQATHTSCGQAC